MMPMWFFQGQERLGRVASLDMLGKVVTAVGIFVIVRAPSDGWKMLALQTGSALVIFSIASREILRLHLITMPTWSRVLTAVRNGWDMFLFTGASSFLGSGNVLLLGLFAPVSVVGYYAGAEKLCRAFVGFLWPLNQAIFPRVNHLCHTDPPAGARLVLRSFAIMGSGGIGMGLAAYALAPYVIRVILGPGFEAAVPVLQLMSPIIAIMPVNIVFGLQWLVPMGIDKAYSRVVLVAVLVNVTFAMLLASRFGQLGMAASVVMTELFVLCCIWRLLSRYRLNPFRIARETVAAGQYSVPEPING
jgi:PST family polysaccharide transporter